MTEAPQDFEIQDVDVPDQADARKRSTIRFPYSDLADAEEIAESMWTHRGLEADVDSVAADLGTTTKSGTFRTKLASAVIFGVLETVRGEGRIRLTDLGRRLTDPNTRAAARADAFLTVPLYKALYDQFRGNRLPGDSALEAEMVRLGVSEKQTSKARQALVRSAEFAGFYATGRDRLVSPSFRGSTVEQSANPDEGKGENHGERPDPGPKYEQPPIMSHPLIQGLLQVLPDPGQTMSADQRKRWLDTLEMNLAFIYPEPSGQQQPSARSQSAAQD